MELMEAREATKKRRDLAGECPGIPASVPEIRLGCGCTDVLYFSDPCNLCGSKKRACVQPHCGPSKKLFLTPPPAAASPPEIAPPTPLPFQRSCSLPVSSGPAFWGPPRALVRCLSSAFEDLTAAAAKPPSGSRSPQLSIAPFSYLPSQEINQKAVIADENREPKSQDLAANRAEDGSMSVVMREGNHLCFSCPCGMFLDLQMDRKRVP